ncbi:MBL fold metallo-hydrolase [Geminicoccus harenae]|uniref:MBL fold metallo-hydrolase n=1 Tax=Geminicoccus harenae TaxID=2498453 RepID=UPI001C941D31|nr:MBL fold metallo-hydrolase [Geminicoccus harenae]
MARLPSFHRRDAFLLAAAAGGGLLASGSRPPAARAAEDAPLPRPSHYSFGLGSFRVTTLLDGYTQGDGPHPIFGQDQPVEAVQELAQANFLPPGRMENSYTPVLVDTGEAVVLFDTGNVPGRQPTAAFLVDHLQAVGYGPDQVDVVVLTHMHGDHIGGLMQDGQPTFPNARYVTGQVEYDFWAADERLSGATEQGATLFRANMMPLAEKTTFLADEGEVVPGIRAVAAFGHSPGHMAYHIESDGQRLLLWADTANHYVMSVQRPDWHVRFDMDKEAAAATRRRILDMAAADRLLVSGYHMPFPALGFIERSGESFRWVPVSYQLNL